MIFGQGRSDHAPFVSSGVPSLFFTDSTNGCYHTVLDDIDHYEAEKHLLQIDVGSAVVDSLLTASEPPSFDADAPTSTHADAVELLELIRSEGADLSVLPDGGVATAAFADELDAIVANGPAAYDAAAEAAVLGGAAQLVQALDGAECLLPEPQPS